MGDKKKELIHVSEEMEYQDALKLAENADALLAQEIPDGDGSNSLMRCRSGLAAAEREYEHDRMIIIKRHAKVKDGRLLANAKGEPVWLDEDEKGKSPAGGHADQAQASIMTLQTQKIRVVLTKTDWNDILDEDGEPPKGKGIHLLFFRCDKMFINAPWQDPQPEAEPKKKGSKAT